MNFEQQLTNIVWNFSSKWLKPNTLSVLQEYTVEQIGDIFNIVDKGGGVYFGNTILSAQGNKPLYRFVIEKGNISELRFVPIIHWIDAIPETSRFFSILKKWFESPETYIINQTEMWPYWNTFSCVKPSFLHNRIVSRDNSFVSASNEGDFIWDMYQVIWFATDNISWNPTTWYTQDTSSILESVTYMQPQDILWIVTFPDGLGKQEVNSRIEMYKEKAPQTIILFSWNGVLKIHAWKEAWYAWILKDYLEEYVNRENRVSRIT